MSDDYLWDRTGSDPEVERLEKALRPMGLPVDADPPALPRRLRPRVLLLVFPLTAAAAALSLYFSKPPAAVPPAPPGVLVESAGRVFAVAEGEWIEGGGFERVIRIGTSGEVRVGAGARVRIVRSRADESRLRLEEGTVHARISAGVRPRFFQIETPATTCVDLGCAYTLTVDAAGNSVVRVLSGRVAFEDGNREVYVPSGAVCTAEKGRGAGTPYFHDSSVRDAVRKFDAARGEDRHVAARRVMAGSPRDSLTLWHLLQDSDEVVRSIALQGLERIQETPSGVTREATLAGEKPAVQAWRDALERHWF